MHIIKRKVYEYLEIDHPRISLTFFQIHSTFFKAMYGDKSGEFCTWISGAKRVKHHNDGFTIILASPCIFSWHCPVQANNIISSLRKFFNGIVCTLSKNCLQKKNNILKIVVNPYSLCLLWPKEKMYKNFKFLFVKFQKISIMMTKQTLCPMVSFQ